MQPKEVVLAWVEAFNRADVETLTSFYAENAVNHQVAESSVEGRNAIGKMFEAEFAAAAMVCIVDNIFQDGEWGDRGTARPLGKARLWFLSCRS